MRAEGAKMKIFGKSFSDYLIFERGFLILIVAVGLTKLVLSFLGVPNSALKFLSLTVLLLAGMLYYSVRVHTSRFGDYKQLLPVLALQVIAAQSLIVAGIVFAILTGHDNIFTIREFAPGKTNATWGHAASHVMAMIVFPLFLWLLGSLVMFVTKKLSGGRAQKQGAAGI
jgi:hypothetical protein